MATYSTYEAKARLSEVLRLVREGHPVTITYRGEPVAEIRPVDGPAGSSLERRLGELERHGEIIRGERRGKMKGVSRRPGALQRFVADRGK
jgi:prevent-host-death family protein